MKRSIVLILLSLLFCVMFAFVSLSACSESTPATQQGQSSGDSGDANGSSDSGNADNGNTDGDDANGGNADNGNTDSGNNGGGNTDSGNTDGGTSSQELTALKSSANASLDTSVNGLLGKVTDETLRGQINAFYQRQKANIEAITSLDGAQAVLNRIKEETAAYVTEMISAQLDKLKTAAITSLDGIVEAGLKKLPSETLKQNLNTFYTQEKAKIQAVETIEDVAPTLTTVSKEIADYAKGLAVNAFNEVRSTAKELFNTLSESFNVSPYDFIPESMVAGYEANLVNASDVDYDFSDFVNVSEIKYGGFGKQWNMVTDNITQSEYFYKYLNAGTATFATALTTVNEYFDSDDADSISKSFDKEGFSANLTYENGIFSYSIEFKKGISIPVFGSVAPTVVMEYNTVTGEKSYKISLSETNALRFSITDNKYEFGIEYGIAAGSRTSYLIIERKADSTVEGHIYEYVTLKGKDVMPACADFYIDEDYVSVVGNKADAMMGTKGYINELYKTSDGKLLGYEVRETLSFTVLGKTYSGDYNTLWFNLNDISGITSIKIGDKTSANDSGKSTADVYLNESTKLFKPTYNTKLGVKTSRKYDIEFRTQYFYSKDSETGKIIEHEVKVPMMFIQEDNDKDDNFTKYPSDMLQDNKITSAVIINPADLDKILADYDRLIDDFIANKQMMNSTEIKSYIAG